MTITNKVKLHRVMCGDITQAELAEAIGVSRQTVIAIEKGTYKPSLEVALKMSRHFGVKLEEVFQLDVV
ncbi:MAG: helix-turn-helix transcriptional regulator [Halieaceae bacterium]|nr:helix-turn-helix transcriptional regulator [Halieaceae bacterium]